MLCIVLYLIPLARKWYKKMAVCQRVYMLHLQLGVHSLVSQVHQP